MCGGGECGGQIRPRKLWRQSGLKKKRGKKGYFESIYGARAARDMA